MSVASMWDEKLKTQKAMYPRDANGYHVGYQDLRALVDDALELERVRAERVDFMFERDGAHLDLAAERARAARLRAERDEAIYLLRRICDGYPEDYRGTYWEDACRFIAKHDERADAGGES